jgi:signal peptidase II
VLVVADQVTKQIVRDRFALGESRSVIDGFFSLTYVRNTGAAWGLFSSQNTWLTVLSVVMLVLLVVYRRSFLGDRILHRIALGLMIGGIVGNLMDRVRLGWVTDFLDFNLWGYAWPAFNIADAAICTGVGLYVLTSIGRSRPDDGTPMP